MPTITHYVTIKTPIGVLLLAANVDQISLIEFDHQHRPRIIDRNAKQLKKSHCDHPALSQTIKQMQAYFAGELQTFSLPLAPQGTTFQQKVWQKLQDIPYGQTVSYAQLAKSIERPTAIRAVGAASARNPLPIVLPCHRVIGSKGALTGFAGGLEKKAYLLRLEGNNIKD